MANTTLTNLPTVTSLNGTEPLLGVQNANSVQITTRQVANYTLGLVGIGLPVTVPNGGTGQSSFTSNALLIGNGTGALQVVPPPSGSNYVLVGSAGSAPSWQATIPVTAGVDSVSFGTTGLTPNTATAGVVSVGFGSSPTAAGIYSPATNQIALSTNSTRQLLIDSTGAATFTTSATSPLVIATASRTATATTGAFSYGTNSFSDTGVLASFQSSVNSYNQAIIQNTSAGASASAEFIAYNDQGTAATNYATVGINSSGYTGTGAINAAGYGYFLTGSTDLVIGTIGANALHIVTNSSATDAITVSSSGVVSLGTALAVTSGGTGQSTALTQYGVVYGASTTAMGITAAGTTGQVLVATTSGAPSWGAIPSTAAVTSITFGTTGLTPNTATTGAVTVAGTLNAANGGTGQSTYAIGDLLYASTTTALSRLADVVTGSVLVSGGVSTAPAWSSSPTLTTSLTTPIHYGGTTASSTLTLQSTSGVGTTDAILFKVGNNGATTAMYINTSGNVGIGTTSPSYKLDVQNSATTALRVYNSTAASGVLLAQDTTGNSQLNNQGNGYLLFGTNNTERMRVDASGYVSIGPSGTSTGANLITNAQITGATSAYAHYNNGVVQSGVTTLASAYVSNISLATASFTTGSVVHFWANPGAGGAGSTITNQYGFYSDNTINTQGAATVTNAYGFYGNIASAANRWNLYMAGTASNYMAGALGIGTTTTSAALLTLASTTTVAMVTPNIAEVATVSATAATGTVNFDVTTQSVLYYTTSASGNWTLNVRGNSGTSLNTMMSTGQSITIAFLVTNGATAYYQSAMTIDGTSVTPKWQGGTAPSAGDASSVDIYTFSIVKTGSAAYTVFGTLTKFA